MGVLSEEDFLTREEWNQLFEVIRDSGMDPRDFQRTMTGSEWLAKNVGSLNQLPTIIYRSPEYWFSIASYDEPKRYIGQPSGGTRYAITRSPGGKNRFGAEVNLSWPEVQGWLRHWFSDLKKELETPDLWAQLEETQQALAPMAELLRTTDDQGRTTDEQELLTRSEKQRLFDALDRTLAHTIETHQLTAGQTEVVREGLDFLKREAGRSTRVAFKIMTIGVLAQWLMTEQLPGEVVKDIADFLVPLLRDVIAPHIQRMLP